MLAKPWSGFVNAAIALIVGILLLVISYHIDVVLGEENFWHDATHEAGFALLVAVVIWFIFELVSSSKTEERWTERIQTMSKSVFLGVFGRNLPTSYVEEATNLVLSHNFIRDSLEVSYTLVDRSYDIEGVGSRGFVCVNATARTKMTNVSDKSANLPIQIGLPNPLVNEIKPFCKVNRVTVKLDGGKEEDCDLSEGISNFAKDLEDDTKYHAIFKVKEVTIAKNRSIEVFFDYTMPKEEEDTEIVHTSMPTARVSITIVDNSFQKREVRARSIHREDLKNNSPLEKNGTYNFTLDTFLLPHQGFAIWWKWIPHRASHGPQAVDTKPID